MATRRSLGMGGEREDDGSGDFDDQGGVDGGIDLLAGGGVPPVGGGPRIDEFGNVVPDFSNDPNFPTPFKDYQPDEIAGNTDTARGMMKSGSAPTSFNLPQGVSVNDASSGSHGGTDAIDTPAMPSEPSPVAWQTPNPMSSERPLTTGGPQRRSASNPAIFADSRSPMLHGRAGGLMGGGLGATGGSELSGPIAPTAMMQKLLQLFQQQ